MAHYMVNCKTQFPSCFTTMLNRQHSVPLVLNNPRGGVFLHEFTYRGIKNRPVFQGYEVFKIIRQHFCNIAHVPQILRFSILQRYANHVEKGFGCPQGEEIKSAQRSTRDTQYFVGRHCQSRRVSASLL